MYYLSKAKITADEMTEACKHVYCCEYSLLIHKRVKYEYRCHVGAITDDVTQQHFLLIIVRDYEKTIYIRLKPMEIFVCVFVPET